MAMSRIWKEYRARSNRYARNRARIEAEARAAMREWLMI
jgi:hypothetical protein